MFSMLTLSMNILLWKFLLRNGRFLLFIVLTVSFHYFPKYFKSHPAFTMASLCVSRIHFKKKITNVTNWRLICDFRVIGSPKFTVLRFNCALHQSSCASTCSWMSNPFIRNQLRKSKKETAFWYRNKRWEIFYIQILVSTYYCLFTLYHMPILFVVNDLCVILGSKLNAFTDFQR